MPAVELSSLCFHVMRAGGAGVGDLALDPRQSNHAAEHVRNVLGGSDSRFYMFQLPVWNHETDSRHHISFPIRLPHEIFSDSWAENPASWDPINFDVRDLPPQFADHEVSREHPGRTAPVGFFSDGVPHTKRDAFIVQYLSNSLTKKRFMISSIRKGDLCRCGCKGQCTLGQINRVVRWSFNALASGLWPAENHEGGPLDPERALKRGFPLAEGWAGALTELRMDLLELTGALGFKTWQNVDHPCFCCDIKKKDLFKHPKSLAEATWTRKDNTAYQNMLAASLKTVHVPDRGALGRLLKGLRLDVDFGGMGAWRNIPEFGLRRGWRVVENEHVNDIHKLSDIPVPEGGVDLVFFDALNSNGLDLVCALLLIKGVTINMVHLDAMHIMDLGVTQLVVGQLFWVLCANNFARSAKRTKTMRLQDNLWHLRRRLKAFYKGLGPAGREKSKIDKITYKMFQPAGKVTKYSRLRAKAAETRHLVPLLPMWCQENYQFLGPRKVHLFRTCTHLNDVYSALTGPRREMSPAQTSRFQRQKPL